MCCFTARSGCHIKYSLVGLRSKGHDGEERGSSLKDIVACEVLWGGTERDLTFEYLKAHLAPFTDGLELHATANQRLGKLSTMCAQGICPNDNWSGCFVGFKNFISSAGILARVKATRSCTHRRRPLVAGRGSSACPQGIRYNHSRHRYPSASAHDNLLCSFQALQDS